MGGGNQRSYTSIFQAKKALFPSGLCRSELNLSSAICYHLLLQQRPRGQPEGSQPIHQRPALVAGVAPGDKVCLDLHLPFCRDSIRILGKHSRKPHTAPMSCMAVALLRVLFILNLLRAENNVPGQDFGLSYTSWEYRIETSIPISPGCRVNIINLVPCCKGNNLAQREESTAAAISSYRWDKADKLDKINPNYTNYFSRSRQEAQAILTSSSGSPLPRG